MRKALACGIDFGTTNSSVSIAYDNGDVELVTIDQSTTMPYSLPSIVYIDRDDFRLAGQEAVEQFMITGALRTTCFNCSLVNYTSLGPSTKCKQFQVEDGCQDARLISGLKSLLAPTENGTTHSWARDFELEDFVAIIIKELKKRVDDIAGDNIRRVVLGYPVVFSGAKDPKHPKHQYLQERAKSRLVRAAKIAGFTDIKLFSEPEAVLLDQPSGDRNVIAVDFGGGTYDVAVLENKGGKAKISKPQGVAIGGEIFDGLLFDNRAADTIGLNQKPQGKTLSKMITNKMRTLAGIPQLLQQKTLLSDILDFKSLGADIDAIHKILFRGQSCYFYYEIEQAKIKLSKSRVAKLSFQRLGRESPPVSRAEFNRWISSHLDRVDETTLAALNESGVTPQDVQTVLRTGGSSRIPQFIYRLETIFPNAEITERDVFASVAYGLGLHALKVWGEFDDKQQPCKEISIPTPKELNEVATSGHSQQDTLLEHKEVHSWVRRFWMWLRRVVWRNKKALKTPQPDVKPVVREAPPDIQPVRVPYYRPKKKLTLEEQAREAARENVQEYGHDIGDFVEKPRLSNDRIFTAICHKCGLNIDGVVEYVLKTGHVKVGGKAKNTTCPG